MRQTGCETGYMTPTYGPRFTSGRTVLAVLPHLLRSYLLTCFLEALLTYLLITYLLITYLLGYLLAITLLMSNAGRYHGWIW
jgi:hypothetical protein